MRRTGVAIGLKVPKDMLFGYREHHSFDFEATCTSSPSPAMPLAQRP